MSNITELNEILFDRLKAINNDELSDEQLEKEIRKAEATTSIASAMLKNASLALAAQKQFDEYGTGRTVDIPLLGISNEDLMHKNKVLRMQLADKEAMR
jgi:hypothetical protein